MQYRRIKIKFDYLEGADVLLISEGMIAYNSWKQYKTSQNERWLKTIKTTSVYTKTEEHEHKWESQCIIYQTYDRKIMKGL